MAHWAHCGSLGSGLVLSQYILLFFYDAADGRVMETEKSPMCFIAITVIFINVLTTVARARNVLHSTIILYSQRSRPTQSLESG